MDNQNYWNGIERRKPSGELEAAYDSAATTQKRQLAVIEELREQVKQQAAVLEQMRSALDSCTPGDYSTGHVIHPNFDVDLVEKAIALQPCPEVLNKVRAEAAMTAIEWVWSKGSVIPKEAFSYVKRIEQGEA